MRRELLREMLYWAAVLGGLGALVGAVFGLHAVKPAPHPEIRHIAAGEAIDDAGSSRAVSLPDDWMIRGAATDHLRYRFPLHLEEHPRELWGLYVPTVHLNASVYVNGQPVGDGGSFDPPVARVWPRPLYFVISPELLHAGENEIDVHVKTEPRGAGLLSDLYAGPDALLQPAYRFRHLLKATAPAVFTGAIVILAGLLASLTLRLRTDPLYGWFAAVLVTTACLSLYMLLRDIPVSSRTWDWLLGVTIGCGTIIVVIFVHRLLGVDRPRVEAAGAIAVVAGSVALALVPGDLYYRGLGNAWAALCLGGGVYPAYLLMRSVSRERRIENLLFVIGALAMVPLGAHDVLFGTAIAPRVDGFLIAYSAPVLALFFAWVLLSRFVDARHEAEALHRDLGQRVRDKMQQIEENHRRLRALEQERALTTEREQILRDVNDGLGGHLASALALSERGASSGSEVAAILRQAGDDLRLVIRSFEPSGSDLAVLLGGLRPLLQRQTDAAGLALHWEVNDTRPIASLGPHSSLQILRIVQEAVTDAVRHSRGTRVTVRSRDASDRTCEVWVEVEGDGQGVGSHSSGRGQGNMQARAHQIGALIEIASASPGTRVRLRLPVMDEAVEVADPRPT